MIATAIKTPVITPQSTTLIQLLDQVLVEVPPGSVLAITSKIVSLCEGSVVPASAVADKQDLVHQHADAYLPEANSKWGYHFTIKDHILISNAGIDESNVDQAYVLWPRDSFATAAAVRAYLKKRFGHDQVGVIITDSSVRPMRRGVYGIALAYSGIKPLKSHVGQNDLFGRPFKVEQADIVGGLAATAVLVMGEGIETTPLALLTDVTAAEFVDREASADELADTNLELADDLFAPFLQTGDWVKRT